MWRLQIGIRKNWLNGRSLDDFKDSERPNSTKGTARFDFISRNPNTVYDLKFGRQGITRRQLNKICQHGPVNAIVKEVKPTDKGGIKQIYHPG